MNKIGVDLGYSHIAVSDSHANVFKEPSVILLEKATRRILSLGNQAECNSSESAMDGAELVRPFKNGLLYSTDITAGVIEALVAAVGTDDKISCVVGVPADFLPKQEAELLSLFTSAGCAECYAVNRAVAALVGAGYTPAMSIISVNIGASATEIAVIHKGQIIISVKEPIGGEAFDRAIKQHILDQGDLNITLYVAKMIKERLGTVWPGKPEQSIEIQGELSLTHTKIKMPITSSDIVGVFEAPLHELLRAIANTIKKIPYESVNDIFENGIILTGGGAELFGLEKMISKVLGIRVTKPEGASDAVAKGLARIHRVIPPKKRLAGKNITTMLAKLYTK